MKGFVMRAGLATLLGLLMLSSAVAQEVPEYQLKAILYFRLSQFVYWPAGSPQPETPVLCVVGDGPFADSLDALARHGGASILRNPAGLQACHLLFISRSERARAAQWVSQADRYALVTVSDISGFATRGGMIELPVEGGRVSIVINRDVARRQGLDFNAQLLRIARMI